MLELDQTWLLDCDNLDGGDVFVNRRTVQKNVLSGDEVTALKVSSGAWCGLLHVHV